MTTRTYSDPSYGSKKTWSFARVSMGTRGSQNVTEVGEFTALGAVQVLDFQMYCSGSGDGGTSQWVLLKGTTALGTLNFVTNPTAGTYMSTAPSGATGTAGDVFRLYSVTSVADPAPFVQGTIEYTESFLNTDEGA